MTTISAIIDFFVSSLPTDGPTEVKLSPKPSVSVEIKQADLPNEPDDHGLPIPLANYVEGVTDLAGIRCPDHEAVEIGIDKQGRINLLAREIRLRDLRIVEAWAKAHRELISLACPDHEFDPAGKTISHVFTDTPTKVTDMYATDIRLYVLTPVAVQDKVGWYAAPLNKPRR
ncbi:MAG: hypothetical protein IH984_16700 [Planctomycetes bacterium]|nr:hypothetical protein [Planctomycetota bacterium]